MRLAIHKLMMPLRRPFVIAHGSTDEQRALIVELSDGTHSGFGEASESSVYGHTIESMEASLERVRPIVESLQLDSGEAVWNRLKGLLSDDQFALGALDVAAHDLYGRTRNRPCYKLWGLHWGDVPDSSLTFGIDTIEAMIRRWREQPEWKVYKLKLGFPDDIDHVRALRRHTAARLYVDVNCGWTVGETIAKSYELRELGVEFIEQPLPPSAPHCDHKRLFRESALPIVADESCCGEADLDACAAVFHGINVKLCKCGGLSPALRMLQAARSKGLLTMVGCMVESSIGISAAAQLLPLLDFADLDGAMFLRCDPAIGITLTRGKVEQPKRPGCGSCLIPVGQTPIRAEYGRPREGCNA
jgi:L-alanine-DL-glutamate epimerase-like enolase superfamily enzyme